MAKRKKVKKSSLFIKSALVKYVAIILIILIPVLISLFLSRAEKISCANSITCIQDLTGEPSSNQKKAEFMGEVIDIPDIRFEGKSDTSVLGDKSDLRKRIFINLTNQILYAVEDHEVKYKFLISSGKWGKTPTGNFKVWIKLDSTRMSGGSRENGTYYDLPNVPWTMYFYNDDIPKYRGFGIHGAYWHNNFGNPMSHGCINMKIEEAKLLYDWAKPVSTGYSTYASDENPGTRIIIYGKAPNY